MKKILALILISMLTLSACGKKGFLSVDERVYPRVYPNPACTTNTCETQQCA